MTEEAVLQIVKGQRSKTIRDRWNAAKSKVLPDQVPTGWEDKSGLSAFRDTNPPLRTGEFFKLSSLQIVLQEISSLYGDQGYAFANVIPVTKPDAENGVMNITFDCCN